MNMRSKPRSSTFPSVEKALETLNLSNNSSNVSCWIDEPHYYDTENVVQNERFKHAAPVKDAAWLNDKYTRFNLASKCPNNDINNVSKLKGLNRFIIDRNGEPLATTLQGHVYVGIDLSNGRRVIIKRSLIKLVESHLSTNNTKINEDIRNEARILEKISREGGDSGIAQFVTFFKDENYYYLVTEHGGHDLFDYICNIHEKIQSNKLSIDEWKFNVKYYFRQLVRSLYYLHVICGITHSDISLENTVIDLIGDRMSIEGKQDVTGAQGDPKLRLIDFGLAREAWNDGEQWKCKEYIGKTQYQAPEIREIRRLMKNMKEMSLIDENSLKYNGRKADIWSLGVMLVIMTLGLSPWQAAEYRCESFKEIINGNLRKVIKVWNRENWIEPEAVDLLEKIFKPENERISIQEIMKHSYVRDAPLSLRDSLDKIVEIRRKHAMKLNSERQKEFEFIERFVQQYPQKVQNVKGKHGNHKTSRSLSR